MSAPATANDIRITRIYDAPVALVWNAWADLEQIAQWWGPRGFTITTRAKELRAGGFWDYTMHGPDGKDWPNYARYHEVVPYQRLVYDHGASSADAAPMFQVTAIFRDLGNGKTEFEMTMTLPTPEAAQQTRGFVKAAGGNSTWDRLAEHVEKQVSSKEVFFIARSFEAPIATVFDMWTTPDHLAAWLPPAGFTMRVTRGAIRTGESMAYAMANSEFTMYARHEYLQVQRPDLIVYTQTFTDADGNTARHPGAPWWPETLLATILLVAEGPGTTRVTVRFDVQGTPTAEEMAAFIAERAGMTRGWSASFDVLDELLAGASARGRA